MGLETENTESVDTSSDFSLTPEGIEAYVEREESQAAKDKAPEPELEAKAPVGEEKVAPDAKDAPEAQSEPNKADTAQAYQPDFVYNTVGGKKAEIPDQVKALIKSKEDETYWKGMLSKADGFDLVKEKGLQSQKLYEELAAPTQEFYNMIERREWKKAFEIAELPVPTIQDLIQGFGVNPDELAQQLVNYMDLTPEQKKLQNEQTQAELRARDLEQRESYIAQRERQQVEQQLVSDLKGVIAQQGISQIAAEFDRKNGQENAFLAEIVEFGARYYERTGQVIPPADIAQHLIKRYGLDALAQPTPQVAQPQPNAMAQMAHKPKPQTLPTIPAIAESSAGSPGDMTFNSLDDLKRYYQKEYGSGL